MFAYSEDDVLYDILYHILYNILYIVILWFL